MKRVRRVACLFAGTALLAFGFFACGDGDNVPPTTTFYTVNASTGSDSTGNGVTLSYKTITKALSVAISGNTVTVAPGTYNLGETFPIVIPSGVKLIGDEANKGNGTTQTLILGGADVAGFAPGFISAAVNPGDNTTISGFTIHDNSASATFHITVVINHNLVTVKNSRMVDNNHLAIYVYGGGTASLLSGNVIQNNDTGIAFVQGAGPVTRVENNVITLNGYGVEYDSPATSGDLGGGTTGSVGGNTIAHNTTADLVTSSVVGTISATNNLWDHVPPIISPIALYDILNAGSTAVTFVTTGASLAP